MSSLNKVIRRFHHHDLIKTMPKKFMFYKKGFAIKEIQIVNPPKKCDISINEVEQLTDGVLINVKHTIPTDTLIKITYQHHKSMLQQACNEEPPIITEEHTIS